LQKPVTFATGSCSFSPCGRGLKSGKTAFFSGCCCKTEVLQQQLYKIIFMVHRRLTRGNKNDYYYFANYGRILSFGDKILP
jgi:hypothetical protein